MLKLFLKSGLYKLLFAVALLGGCAKSVQVAGDFPRPLVEPYPLVAGIRYPASLTGYRHVEKPANEPEVSIDLGAANLQMFRALFAGMFTAAVELGSDPNAPVPANVNLIIEPSLTELELASPDKSGTDQYTVWLNYNLKFYRPDKTALGEWPITAYGQHDAGGISTSGEEAINDTAMVALRDAGATIATEFDEAPGIAELLPRSAKASSADATGRQADDGNN